MNGADFIGTAMALAPSDVTDTARTIGCSAMALRALLAVETGGKGFDINKRPIILYEPHVAYRVCADNLTLQKRLVDAGLAYPVWGTKPYPAGQDAQYSRLDTAVTLVGRERAVQACSWGLGQILGENYKDGSYASAALMVSDAMTGERAQLRQIAAYLEKHNLAIALAKLAWFTVALGYNGKANATAYAAKLAKAYTSQLASVPAPVAPRVQPPYVSVALHPARPADVSADDLTAQWAKDHGINLPDLLLA